MEPILVQVYDDLLDVASIVAQDIFIDYYTPINGKDHATYMANKFLSREAIKQEIDNETVFKLLLLNGQPIGFTEYKIDGNRVFLSKLYVNKEYRKKGFGKMLLDDCIKYTKDNKKNAIYLTVNKHNKTKDLYLHWDFIIIDSVVTDIGNNYVMDDYIMEKKV
ncbi:MAG: GNAT family N-acetyltransferase [Erysipelotrichaceae bacterium]|nr:GNAT family N-acetyltransferase [Erysipelotrichaceae bacterium]